jgi:hypothetical protein
VCDVYGGVPLLGLVLLVRSTHRSISRSTRIWPGLFATASRTGPSTPSRRRLTVTSGWVLRLG